MSTAEVARDMDVLRRAVGDQKLSFLGFGYGTALGQYYANMFPDRVRAVAVDGVINPVTWTGNSRTRNRIQDDRLRSADGAYQALREILTRCDAAGEKFCTFAAGDPVRNFDTITKRLKAEPVTVTDEFGTYTVTYADFIGGILSAPNSRLLSSTNFGHTAYGTSACATGTIDNYLLTGALPAAGTVCQGDIQPFTEPPATEPGETTRSKRMNDTKTDLADKGAPAAGEPKQLPPVATRVPTSTLKGTR